MEENVPEGIDVVDWGSGPVEVCASPWTLMRYEQEFGGSLIADVLGVVELSDGGAVVTADFVLDRMRRAAGRPLPKTTERLVGKAFPARVEAALDFTAGHWEANLRALWAMVATARHVRRASEVGFERWVDGLGTCDMNRVAGIVADRCVAKFFPSLAEGAQEGQAG